MPASTSTTTLILQTSSIALSLLSSSSIATLSVITIPSLLSLPASRSLPQIRWLFSRGSHIYPQACAISAAGFVWLAIRADLQTVLTTLLKHGLQAENIKGLRDGDADWKALGYMAAAASNLGVLAWTGAKMLKTNFELIGRNEAFGGARSAKSAKEKGDSLKEKKDDGLSYQQRAEQSVSGEDQPSQFTDLSGPQGESIKHTTREEDEEVRELLKRFAVLNGVRAGFALVGGLLGLVTALW